MKYVFLSILLVNCGYDVCHDPIDFHTRHGLCVNTNGFPIEQEKVEHVTDIVLDEAKYLYGISDSYALFSHRIRVTYEKHMQYPYTGYMFGKTHIDGTKYEVLVLFQDTECQYNDSLTHELLHVLFGRHKIGIFVQPEYSQEQNKNSMQVDIEKRIAIEVCNM